MLRLSSCHCCGLVQTIPTLPDEMTPACRRCRASLDVISSAGDNQTASALAIAALILFIPAITLPFLRIEQLGHASEQSLLGGLRALFAGGAWFVATVVLLFSLILPPAKLAALLILSHVPDLVGRPRSALVVYRAVEHAGRWGMLDVLLVAVLVAFVKLGDIVAFTPQPGLAIFGGFVLLSLLASYSFNPHYLWSEGATMAQPSPDRSSPDRSESESDQPPASDAAQPRDSQDAPLSVEQAMAWVPQAVAHRRRGWSWMWLVPVLAVAAVAAAVYFTWAEQGTLITITFAEGQGLKAGDALRYKGIAVGEVEEVRLQDDLDSVSVHVRLTPHAQRLARRGTRFWIVRPEVGITEISGLETVVGAKYLSVLPAPADAERETHFVGLTEAPLLDALEKGGLEIVLQADDASGLRRGSPIYYRRLRVGGVQSIGLASDGSAIEVVAYIRPQFEDLIRANTKFWIADGLRIQGGFTGLSVEIGSVETLLTSGVAMAVPPDPGEPVERGHRFVLREQAEEDWLGWKPTLGESVVPERLPRPRRAILEWTHDGTLWDEERRRSGWLLRVDEGLLGPADLLIAPPTAVADSTQLYLEGAVIEREQAAKPAGEGVALLDVALAEAPVLPIERRHPSTPEDVLLVADADDPPLFVSAARLAPEEGTWLVDPATPVAEGSHGAAAVAVRDGAVIGFLLVEEGVARISPLKPVDEGEPTTD